MLWPCLVAAGVPILLALQSIVLPIMQLDGRVFEQCGRGCVLYHYGKFGRDVARRGLRHVDCWRRVVITAGFEVRPEGALKRLSVPWLSFASIRRISRRESPLEMMSSMGLFFSNLPKEVEERK